MPRPTPTPPRCSSAATRLATGPAPSRGTRRDGAVMSAAAARSRPRRTRGDQPAPRRARRRRGRPPRPGPPPRPRRAARPDPARPRPGAGRGRGRRRLVVRLRPLHATPGVIGLTEAEATQRLEAAGLQRRGRRPVVLRQRLEGRRARHRPRRPATGCSTAPRSTIRVSLGREVYELPVLTDISRGRGAGPDPEDQGELRRTTERWSETVRRGHRHPLRPRRPARPCAPARSSTWSSARAASPSRSARGSATSRRRAAALEQRALIAEVRSSTPTPSPRAT